MRKFMVSCRDNRTGLFIVLSECTYNMACDWIEETVYGAGGKVCGTEYRPLDDLMEIRTTCRKFFYDEKRGYLLGE